MASKKQPFSLNSKATRAVIYQIIVVAILVAFFWYLAANTMANLAQRGIQSGFDFLSEPASFDIGETVIPFNPIVDSYARAFVVGLLNTIRVAIVGLFTATIIGTLLGIGRFSSNALIRGICYGYVETFRNIPVLLQLLLWYLVFVEVLPPLLDAVIIWDVIYLSKEGFAFPSPIWEYGHLTLGIGLIAGCIAAYTNTKIKLRSFEQTGVYRNVTLANVLFIVGFTLLGWAVGGFPNDWSVPVHEGFSLQGGMTLTPEFMAVYLGLSLYTAAFIGENVRSGIAAVSFGQLEAAKSLGLAAKQSMRFIIFPQALRVIVPPVTNQYLNLTKNSSLAVAVGYPDIVSVSNTSLNQTGRAIECITLIIIAYLILSLATSALMNWYNKRVAILER